MPAPVAVVLLLIVFSQMAYAATAANIVSDTKRLSQGQYTYHYSSDYSSGACQTLLILGVGTGMKTTAYDEMAKDIARKSPAVVFIVDHNPWRLAKTSGVKFASLANALVQQIDELLPAICAESSFEKTIMIGGHSASGQAAWNSVDKLNFEPSAIVGLDPFRLDATDTTDIPTLNFGFTETSCMVTANQAGKAGYQASSTSNRVFVQMDNTDGSVGHCSFTDAGCYGVVCPKGANSEWVQSNVGTSVAAFLTDLQSGNYNRIDYDLETLNTVTVFVNDDEIPVDQRVVRNLRGTAKHQDWTVPATAG